MGHWYTIEAKPLHTVVGKNGKERDTTLADARKLNLFPSATTILGEWNNSDLDRARNRLVMEQAYLTPINGKDVKVWIKEVTEEAMKPWNYKAEFGTKVHAAIEAKLKGDTLAFDKDEVVKTPDGEGVKLEVFVNAGMKALKELDIGEHNIRGVEKTVVQPGKGYAGTIDLLYDREVEPMVLGILDFKTTSTRKDEPILFKKTHAPQIAAYWMAAYSKLILENPSKKYKSEGINVYISTTEPGRYDIRKYSSDELVAGLGAFACCLALWQLDNDYIPNPTPDTNENDTNGSAATA